MSGYKFYIDNWHIKKEIISAIESTNCKEAEVLIIKTKLKEFMANILNIIFGLSAPFSVICIIGLIFGDEHAKKEMGEMLLWFLPAAIISFIISSRLKNNIMQTVNDFIDKKKINISEKLNNDHDHNNE